MAMRTQGAELEIPDLLPARPRRRRLDPRGWSTPFCIRALTAVAVALAVALGAVATTASGDLRAGLTRIGHDEAPRAIAAAELPGRLSEMDAQLANVLLAGREDAGVGRSAALALHGQARTRAGEALQRATAGAGPAARREAATVQDGMDRYGTLAAQAVLLDEQTPHLAGPPPAPALQRYREATDLLRGTALPAAERLARAHRSTLDRGHDEQFWNARGALAWFVAFGLALLLVLVVLQVVLFRRLRRLVNPAVLLATVAALALIVPGTGLLAAADDRLRPVNREALDATLTLSGAQAIGRAMNADASRYLLDPDRRVRYQEDFTRHAMDLAGFSSILGGAVLELDSSPGQGDPPVRGRLGEAADAPYTASEQRHLTEITRRVVAYEKAHRRTRELVTGGRLTEAVRHTTGYQPGDSNHAFARYDEAVTAFLEAERGRFDRRVAAGVDETARWDVFPGAAAAAVSVLLLIGLRPRLAEFR